MEPAHAAQCRQQTLPSRADAQTGTSGEDGCVAWAARRVIWVECPCKQAWKCAHAGCLLWVILLWGVARMDDHKDSDVFGLTAYQCWWLGLSEKYVAAHLHNERTVPAYKHDLTQVLTGRMPGGAREAFRDNEAQNSRGVLRPSTEPIHYLDRYDGTSGGKLAGETFDDWPWETRAELHAAVNEGLKEEPKDDITRSLSISAQMGMSGHQFTFDHGGEWLLTRKISPMDA